MPKPPPYPCLWCDEGFPDPESSAEHMMAAHEDQARAFIAAVSQWALKLQKQLRAVMLPAMRRFAAEVKAAADRPAPTDTGRLDGLPPLRHLRVPGPGLAAKVPWTKPTVTPLEGETNDDAR